MNQVSFLETVVFVVGLLGALAGIDLLMGAKIISILNRGLNATVLNLDNVLASFKRTVETRIDIDEKIIKSKTRMILGVVLLVVGICLILIANRT